MYSAKELAIARLIKPDIEVAQLDVTDLAVLQLVRKATGGGSGVYNATISNGIAYFDRVTASQPLVSLKLNLPVTQTGSGTPAPDNIRDIVGVQGVTIGQTSGYGEYFRGLLNGTYGFVDLGNLNWYYQTTNNTRFYSSELINAPTSSGWVVDLICSNYSKGIVTSATTDDMIIGINNGNLYLRNTSKTNADLDGSHAEWLDGVYLIYELAEPSTPVTPEQFATLCQAFGITGEVKTIALGQTVYGGELAVINGVLTFTVTHELKTIDENSNVQIAENGIFLLDSFFNIREDTESINCNVYQRGENRTTVARVMSLNPDLSFCCKTGTNTTRIMIKDTRFESLEDYQTWLSTNPVKIAVKLAEPIEIDLTPTVINTLIGENVIFADVADVTECKYTRK